MEWFYGKQKETSKDDGSTGDEIDLNSSHYTEKLREEIESFSVIDTDEIVQRTNVFCELTTDVNHENELDNILDANMEESKNNSANGSIIDVDEMSTDNISTVAEDDGNNKSTDTIGLSKEKQDINMFRNPYKFMPMRSFARPFGILPYHQTCLWNAQTKPFYKECCDILNQLDELHISSKPNRDLANTILENSPSCKKLMDDIIFQLKQFNIANIDIESASKNDYITIVRVLYNMKYCVKTETIGSVIMVTIYPNTL